MGNVVDKLKVLDGARIIGMRKTYYVGSAPGSDENEECDDAFNPMHHEICNSYEVMLVDKRYGNKHIIRIENEDGWCGSGYTTAKWYNLTVRNCVDNFGPMTHKPRFGNLKFTVNEKDPEEYWACEEDGFSTSIFVIHDNDDGYYPFSYVDFNEDMFELIPRAFDRRPVYIFTGGSGTGKSTIAMLLGNQNPHFTVYETDKSSELPDVIYAQVVVVGKKYSFDLKDIESRLFDNPKIIFVNFEAQN